MAVGQISTTNGTAGTTNGSTATATITASIGDALIVVAGCDNQTVEALSATAVTDSAGNTWTRLLSQQTTTTALTHCDLAIYGTTVTNALTGGTVTLTAHASSPVKDFTLYRFTGLSLTIRGLNSGPAAAATTPAPLATSAALSGDLVIVATVLEGPTSDTWTADSDTTNGSWSANATDGTTGGTATSQISVRSQYKVVNAAGTQTYNGSNGTARDMQRGILALAPTPPPASAPSPPLYVPQSPINFSTGVGRITVAQNDSYAIGPNFNPELPPVIWNPGVASPAEDLTGQYLPANQPIIHALVDLGFAIVAPTTLYTFGNATAMTAIGAAITWARTNLGCSSGRAVLIGSSEGACDSLTYAFTNPTLVSCVVGLIPVVDLAEMVEQDVLGLAAAVLAAHGVGALPLPSTADPNTTAHRATLAQIPMQLWYATDDAVSANATAFRDATGCDLRAVGPFGHSNASIAMAWPTDIARFIRTHVPVRYGSRVF